MASKPTNTCNKPVTVLTAQQELLVCSCTHASPYAQDLLVCREDAKDQQECTTSSQTDAHPHAQSAAGTELQPAEDKSSGTHVEEHADASHVQQLPSTSSSNQQAASPHSADAAMAESELMAENVPEAVQRLASCDSHVNSSTSGDLPSQSSDPVLTSPTSVAVSAADAYNCMSASKDDDSDSEYGLEFNPYSFVRTLPPLSEVLPPHHKPLLPPQTRRFARKTLVLDLDETLVSPSSLLASWPACRCLMV